MKRILISLAALVMAATTVFAQDSDAILAKIAGAHNGGLSVDKRFVEVRTKLKKTETLKGKLTFSKPDTFDMVYDNGELFSIAGSKMSIKRGSKTNNFDLSKNKIMAGLSHTLLYSFQGVLGDLAKEQNSIINAVKEKEGYRVTLTPAKKLPRGFSKVEVVYSLSDCSVVSILLEEIAGNSTFYSWE